MISLKRYKVLVIKEVRDVFLSPLVYILSALFGLMMGWLFFNYIIAGLEITEQTMTRTVFIPLFGNMNFIFLFLAPMLTMRSFSEERKDHTLNFLLSSKLTELEIILAKLTSSFAMAAFMIGLTLVFPVVTMMSGYSDWGVIFTSYAGLLLCVLCYLSVGLLASSLTESQVVAALLGFTILFGLMLLVLAGSVMNNPMVSEMLQFLSINSHYESFVSGAIRSYNIFYFISFIGFFTYLTYLSLTARKWS